MSESVSSKSEFLKPWNVINLLIGICGIGLAFYFYRASQPSIRVGYVVKTELVARLPGNNFGLTKDGVPLETRTLYRTIVGIWNAGSVSLERSSVRRTLAVEFTRANEIVDANLIRVSHNVSGFRIGKFPSKIEADWTYYDPGFYLVIEVMHSLDEPSQVSLRYIGDQDIAVEIPKAMHGRYAFGLFVLGGVTLLVGLAALLIVMNWIVLLLKKFGIRSLFGGRMGVETLLVALTTSLFFALIFSAPILFTSSKAITIARTVMDIAPPAEFYELFEIDKEKLFEAIDSSQWIELCDWRNSELFSDIR